MIFSKHIPSRDAVVPGQSIYRESGCVAIPGRNLFIPMRISRYSHENLTSNHRYLTMNPRGLCYNR